MAQAPSPLDEPQFEGRKLVPAVSVGCLAFGVLMSLACYWIWFATKDHFIEQARREGQSQAAQIQEDGKPEPKLTPDPDRGNGMWSP